MDKNEPSSYVALLPAAGIGSRLPNRQLSKELLPIGGGKPVMSHILRCFEQAGVEDLIVVLRKEKQDIADYLIQYRGQARVSVVTTPGTSGVPETVALGLQHAGNRNVVFGFPDILFEPDDAFKAMMVRLESSSASAVLGLFPTDNPTKFDMVATDADGRVEHIDIKPRSTSLNLTWILAAWEPSFSDYLVARRDGEHLGHAFQAAMADGFVIDTVSFDDGRTLDIGTPGDLELAQGW